MQSIKQILTIAVGVIVALFVVAGVYLVFHVTMVRIGQKRADEMRAKVAQMEREAEQREEERYKAIQNGTFLK